MNSLLLFIDKYQKFDRENALRLLLSIEEIYFDNLAAARRDPFVNVIEGFYDYDGDNTIVTFQADSVGMGTIWFRGTGPAAVDLVFRIQQGYPEPLRVVDQAYNFDLLVSDYGSAAELSDAMDKASGVTA